MKHIILFILAFSCVSVYSQVEKLPHRIENTFRYKYPTSTLESWKTDNNLYYLDFILKTNSYTSAFNKRGVWMETSEIVSEFDIPEKLLNYVCDYFPEGTISYCEKVETPNLTGFFRVNLYNNGEFIVIQSKDDGTNIKIIKEERE